MAFKQPAQSQCALYLLNLLIDNSGLTVQQLEERSGYTETTILQALRTLRRMDLITARNVPEKRIYVFNRQRLTAQEN